MTPFLRNDLRLLVAVPLGTVVRRRPLVWSFGSCHFRRRGDALPRLFVALLLLLAPFLLLLLRLVVLGRVLHVALGFGLLAAARPALRPHVRWQGQGHWHGAPLGTCRTCRSRGYGVLHVVRVRRFAESLYAFRFLLRACPTDIALAIHLPCQARTVPELVLIHAGFTCSGNACPAVRASDLPFSFGLALARCRNRRRRPLRRDWSFVPPVRPRRPRQRRQRRQKLLLFRRRRGRRRLRRHGRLCLGRGSGNPPRRRVSAFPSGSGSTTTSSKSESDDEELDGAGAFPLGILSKTLSRYFTMTWHAAVKKRGVERLGTAQK